MSNNDQTPSAPEQAVLEGQIAIRAALQSGNRKVHTVYIDETKKDRSGDRARFIGFAVDHRVEVKRVGPDVIAEHVSGHSHGGVIALAGPRRFVSPAQLLKGGRSPFIVMIDGVEDPFNFGASVRAIYAAGADGLVLRPRNWMSAAGVVARSSAGASERIPTAIAETAVEAAKFFRKQGFTIATTSKKNAVSLYEADLTRPLFLLIGGEKRGITRSFLEQADLALEIPYGRKFGQSLGTVGAASVLAFEIMRQRQSANN